MQVGRTPPPVEHIPAPATNEGLGRRFLRLYAEGVAMFDVLGPVMHDLNALLSGPSAPVPAPTNSPAAPKARLSIAAVMHTDLAGGPEAIAFRLEQKSIRDGQAHAALVDGKVLCVERPGHAGDALTAWLLAKS